MAKRHFPAGEMSPVTILALKQDGQFDMPAGEREIAKLTKILTTIDGVESVRSIAEPTGTRPGYFQPFRLKGLNKLAARKHRITKANYVTQAPGLVGDVARFDLVLRYDPFSLQAIDLLNEIDARLSRLSKREGSSWHQANFEFLGTTVGIRDLKAVTSSDQTLIQQLVVISVLAVLLVILRRPLICLYLIASVLLSYYVTIGATELVFQTIYGSTFHGLDWKVPIFLFVILIAVGEDYNIYLCTRVFEEQRRHGPIEGLRLAVSRTGGIITSCGVIMAGTFVSMMTGTLRGMMELGFALSLGVMLDTCIVRPILVPAFLALLERAKWRMSVTARVPVPIAAATRRQMSPE
jgi:putative drug exporter of the RND superfamily